jgi:LacI family purine nucleotide synthesis repressor
MNHSSTNPPPDPQPVPKRAPTIHDVAAALGMHKSTVSLGLSGKGNVSLKTRARIEEKAREMGYQPNPLAQRLATNAGNNLVCLCAGDLDVGITTEKILLIQKELTARGLEAPIYTLPARSENADSPATSQAAQIRYLCRQQPRAIVCSAQAFHPAVFPELAAYQNEGGIVVAYDVAIPLECDQVVFDREHNGYLAARHLIERGHRKLGLALSVVKRDGGGLNVAQNARLSGFSRALDEAGLTVNRDWIWEETTYESGGAALAAHFLEMANRPTGICIVNDYMALSFMAEVMRAGVRIPEDLSVMGHDNQIVAAYTPVPLSSSTQPETEIAAAVIRLLSQRLNGSSEAPRTVLIRGEVVERQSVAAPKTP